MNRQRAIVLLTLIGVVAAIVSTLALLPKTYKVGDRVSDATVFWHDKEAFVFLDISTSARARNIVEDKLAAMRYGFMLSAFGAGDWFYENHAAAYRLAPSGRIVPEELPARINLAGRWVLKDGDLQFEPIFLPGKRAASFRWDGSRFVAMTTADLPPNDARESRTLLSDDEADDDADSAFLTPASRASLKAAGWHWKRLSAYQASEGQAILPIEIGKSAFDLELTSFPQLSAEHSTFDPLAFGIKNLTVSPRNEPQLLQTIWAAKGWQTITREEFEERRQLSGTAFGLPHLIWLWLALFLFALLVKFGVWGHFAWSLFGMKRRMLKKMATSYSFPPATPAQFPLLDTAALERYTQEFERMSFVRLLDFSLASNGAKPVPAFCRLMVHTRHHCFGEVLQLFPVGKAPMPLRCSIQGVLEDGWTLAFSNGKPQATGSLVRRRRGLGVNMPDASPNDLLNSFLQMRSQVCQDLGISPLKDDTLEAYIAKTQKALADIRDAVKQKNFASAIPHVYLRKFSLLKTKPEYMWLGDYPKEAERRKQGFVAPVGAL